MNHIEVYEALSKVMEKLYEDADNENSEKLPVNLYEIIDDIEAIQNEL